jgi:hypothetical protein
MEKIFLAERKSKIETLQKNINIKITESKVRSPHPSIKTLFNGHHPKNRKNLKKLDIRLNNIKKNEKINLSPKRESIQSLIKISKTEEFLTQEKPNNYNGIKIIPLKNFSSSSTLYSLNNNNNNNNFNNNNSNNLVNGNYTNSNNNLINLDLAYLNSADSLPLLKEKKLSTKKKSLIEIQQEKDLKELYQEYIQNVSKFKFKFYFINNIEYNSKINT